MPNYENHIDQYVFKLYPTIRNLDGVYFWVKRNDNWENICFTDLTLKEQNEIIENKNDEWLKSMILILAETFRNVADKFDIVREKIEIENDEKVF